MDVPAGASPSHQRLWSRDASQPQLRSRSHPSPGRRRGRGPCSSPSPTQSKSRFQPLSLPQSQNPDLEVVSGTPFRLSR